MIFRRAAFDFAVLVPALVLAACAGGAPAPSAYSFDGDPAGSSPSGIALHDTGEGGPARWRVVADPDAPSPPHVLEQQDGRGENPRFAVALAAGPVVRDVRVSVSMLPVTGELDRSGGIVFRASSPDDYYVVRANVLENDVSLYRTVGGMRTLVAAWEQRLARRRWHRLEVEARGERILVRWNGETVLNLTDTTHAGPGRCGLWTKADSVTRFDDLTIEPLDAR